MKQKQTPIFLVLGLPFFVLLAGVCAAAWIAVKQIPGLLEETDRGVLPGEFEVTLPTTGDYTLWLHMQGRFGNEMYHGSGEVPPGGKVFLFDSATGREVELRKEVNAEKNLGEDRAVSLGVFTGDRAGQKIEIKGAGLNSELLLSISHTSSRQILGIVILIAALIMGALVFATILFIQLVRRRQRETGEDGG